MELLKKRVVIEDSFEYQLSGDLTDVIKFLSDIETEERDNFDKIIVEVEACEDYGCAHLNACIYGYRNETKEEAQARLNKIERDAERQIRYATGNLNNIAKKHGVKLIEDYLKENSNE